MEIRNRVEYSESLVRDIESLSSKSWAAMRSHRLHTEFMREYMVAKCVTDFWSFIRFGVYTKSMKHFYEPLHGPHGLAGYLQDWTREKNGVRESVGVKFVVVAREHIKTQTTIAWDCWQYARDPNATLLLRAYTKPKAVQILGGVKELLESDQFRRNFPWVRPRSKRGSSKPILWQADQFMLEREDTGKRVPSAEAVGMGVDPTGGHFSICHYDDFEVKENAESEILLEQLHSTWKNDSNLRLAGNKTVVCGTTWGRKGIIYSVAKRLGDYADHQFDLFYQPVYMKMDWMPLAGAGDAHLLGDRQTVRVEGAGFPTDSCNLELCQARLSFFSPAVNDTVEEVREIVWNDGQSFRVNRPFAEMLGEVLTWKVGNLKPAAPNRFTMDSQDIHPPEALQHDILSRHSIPKKKLEQGSLVFAAQMELDPSDPENMALNPDFLQVKQVSPESGVPLHHYLPDGPKRWFRSCDYASEKEGTAYTAMMEGFRHEQGLFITHITHERQMNDTDKLLNLFLGQKRVQRLNGHLEWTSFEKAAIENTLGGFLSQAERSPYEFFSALQGKYTALAEGEFADRQPIHVPRRILSRPSNLSKNARISQQQPMLESRQIHVILGHGFVSLAGYEALKEEMRYFRLDGRDSYDLLDVLHDLVSFSSPPEKVSETVEKNRFDEINRQARFRNALARNAIVFTGWSGR